MQKSAKLPEMQPCFHGNQSTGWSIKVNDIAKCLKFNVFFFLFCLVENFLESESTQTLQHFRLYGFPEFYDINIIHVYLWKILEFSKQTNTQFSNREKSCIWLFRCAACICNIHTDKGAICAIYWFGGRVFDVQRRWFSSGHIAKCKIPTIYTP